MATKVTGVQAFAAMKKIMDSKKSGYKNLCQKTCRTAWGLAGGIPSAKDAWAAVPEKHRNKDPKKAPIGAPHFWLGGQYGHVALQSDKVGVVISTDAPTVGTVGEVPVEYFVKNWHKEYAGWASNYCGQDLSLKDMPK